MLTARRRLMLFAPLVLIVVPFLLCPVIFGLAASFTSYAPFQANVHFLGLENYARLLDDSIFRTAFGNGVRLTIITVPTEIMIGLGGALLLKDPFRGRGVVRFLLLIPWLISPVASGVMWRYLLNPIMGVLNFWPALLGLPRVPYLLGTGTAVAAVMGVEIWRKAPLVTFLILPGLISIPAETWDDARMDGLRLLAQVRHVIWPRRRILLLSIALLLFGDALGTSDSILMLTGGGPGVSTLTPGLYSYQHASTTLFWSGGTTSGLIIGGGVAIFSMAYLLLTRGTAEK
jgi:multiple sugar transport system permease protein